MIANPMTGFILKHDCIDIAFWGNVASALKLINTVFTSSPDVAHYIGPWDEASINLS